MKILVTGGCGYTGILLTEALLEAGHQVTVVDIQWFGNALEPHQALTVVEQDIREMDPSLLEGVEAIFHLANIANDPSVDLDPTLSWEVNVLAAMQLAEGAVRAGVEAAGIQSLVTKSLGSANPHNVVRATFSGLMALKDPAAVARFRGKEEAELIGA